MRWGNELADNLGLPSYLESSPYGYRLYKRYGFEEIAYLDYEVNKRWYVPAQFFLLWGKSTDIGLDTGARSSSTPGTGGQTARLSWPAR